MSFSKLSGMGHSSTADCKRMGRELAETLKTLAGEFDDVQSKLDKAKLSFAATGAAGGILTIIGLALIPVTFGASLGLSITGGIIGGLSAAGNISSLIADKVISGKTMKKAEEKLKEYSQMTESIKKKLPEMLALLNDAQMEKLKRKIKESSILNKETKEFFLKAIRTYEDKLAYPVGVTFKLRSLATATFDVVENAVNLAIFLSKGSSASKTLIEMGAGAGAMANVANAGKAVGIAADVGVDAAKTTGKVALSGAKIAGMAAAGAGLALDLGAIVYYSVKVHKQEPSTIAQNIRKVASCFS